MPGNKRPPLPNDGVYTLGDLTRFRTELMYPYDRDQTDITVTKSYHDQALPFHIPFFGFRYSYIWVSSLCLCLCC